MLSCPACGNTELADRTQCHCGADLTLLRSVDAQVDAWFNRALEASQRDEPGEAAEWLAACCRARPTDAPAWRALARMWARMERWKDARRCLDRAAAIQNDLPDLDKIRAAIDGKANASDGRRAKRRRGRPPKRGRRR